MWADTAWIFPDLVKINQHVLVWKTSKPFKVFANCRFCNPCRPYLMLEINSERKDWLHRLDQLINIRSRQLKVTVILHEFVPKSFVMRIKEYNSKTVSRFIHRTILSVPPKITHPVIISHIVPDNTSIRWKRDFSSDDMFYQ